MGVLFLNMYFSDISTSPLVPKSLGGSTNLNHVQSIQQINGHPSPLRHVKSEERLNDDGSTSSASSPGCGNRGGAPGDQVALPVTTSMTNLSLKQVADMDCWSTEDDELTLQYPGMYLRCIKIALLHRN